MARSDFPGPPVGFSGPRYPDETQRRLVHRFYRGALLDIRPREATSGCALGCDTVGILLAEELGVPLLRLTIALVRDATGHEHRLVGNPDLLAHAERDDSGRWQIEYGQPGRNAADGFLRRDDLTVARSRILLAAPKTPLEEMRGSGTWATIRRARKARIERRYQPLNGDRAWVESDGTLNLF